MRRREPGGATSNCEVSIAEHQTTVGGCGVGVGTLAGEDAETDLALHEIMDGVDEMAQISSEIVKFPHDEDS